MPTLRCCYCAKALLPSDRRTKATEEQLIAAAAYRVALGYTPRVDPHDHLCSTHRARPPVTPTAAPLAPITPPAPVTPQVSVHPHNSSACHHVVLCVLTLCSDALVRSQKFESRRALSDITNLLTPIQPAGVLRRTASTPPRHIARPANSRLEPLQRHAAVVLTQIGLTPQ